MIGQINLLRESYELYLQKTQLDWMVIGGASSREPSKIPICYTTNLDNLMSKFWIIEEVTTDKSLSDEEREWEAHFLEMFRVIREASHLSVYHFLERKLNANATLRSDYTQVVNEYLKLNMTLIKNPEDGYYLPHHVIKETSDTTKVKIVFDVSAKKNNGTSL
ncbi:PREDICTED: uncharacterized protein LOC105620024 [Atta cephalotes]|uniref:Uncharacterized protein n=1 Tax=Atta cephalotes TaxID=12957 RepID=A0A158NHB8_ATTCE|nr:PREDICTED: uncharacterized protein LOC105620024 [Atta cephalotes]